MTSQANHVTQNVARTKLGHGQYLTLVKVSSNSMDWLMRNRVKLGGKKKKNQEKKKKEKKKKKKKKK